MCPRRFLKSLTAASIAVLCHVAFSSAQDLDVVVQSVNAKLVSGTVNIDDDPSSPLATLGVRVHARSFDELFALDEPGFNSISTMSGTLPPGASALPGGAELVWDFLPMKVGMVASNLLYWNGAEVTPVDVSFGAAPSSEYSLSLFGEGGQRAAADGSATIVAGRSIGTTAADGFLHRHRFFFLDNDHDDNNFTVAAEGIYLVAMRLRMAGLNSSDPIFLVWGTPDASQAALDAATELVEDSVDLLSPSFAADFDGDLDVDGADFLTWQRGVGTTAAALQTQGDANYDHAATSADLDVLRSQLGSSMATFAGPSWEWESSPGVPEPTGIALAAIALSAAAWRSRGH